MGMKFEALQARYGDSLLLTFEGDATIRLLVDGGPAGVYRTSLSPRLLLERKTLPRQEPLVIDAVMVSHIDEDHILGILDLFGELQDCEQRHAPWPYRPSWLLHNSLDSLAGEGEGGLVRASGGVTVLASLEGEKISDGIAKREMDPVAVHVLQSYGQGSKLSTLSASLQIERNPPDRSVLMLEEGNVRTLKLGNATLKIVGPMASEVEDLRKNWSEWKTKKNSPDARQALAAYLDDSVPNLSSVVALVEHEGRKVLLTGDARGDRILEGLEKAGLLANGGSLEIDVLKLPHHGSARNMGVDFFERIKADHYVASGDGTYGNPDRNTLLMLEQARPTGNFDVHLTYSAQSCDDTHKQWRAARGKPSFKQGRDSIADVVKRWGTEGRIAVHEGAVQISY